MKILHVIASLNPEKGGVTHAVHTMASMLERESTANSIVSIDSPESRYGEKVEYQFFPLGPQKGAWGFSSSISRWLTAHIGDFDVILINGLWLYHSYATWDAVRKFKKQFPDRKAPRVLVMPHGMLDPYFQKAKERRIKAIRNWFYWKLIEHRIVNDADGILFTCQTELLLARTTFTNYHPKKEYNVGYGIERPPVYHAEMTKAFNKVCPDLLGKPYILFLSRIDHKKGTDLLVSAYLQLYQSTSDFGNQLPHLVIAGPGIDTLFGKRLKEEVSLIAGAESVIHFPGMVSGDAKWGAFYGCEGFVLPSHQENFGIAVVEALACGKPVLISNQVNIWPEIEGGNAGIIAEDTLEGTSLLLKKWLALTMDQKTDMINNTKTVYENYFAVNQATKKLLQVISDDRKG